MNRLKSTALVSYPMPNILLNFSDKRRQHLTEKGDTPVGFLSVCCTQQPLEKEKGTENEEMLMYGFTSSITLLLESIVWDTADSGVERRMEVLQGSIKVEVGPLYHFELEGFLVKPREVVERKFILLFFVLS